MSIYSAVSKKYVELVNEIESLCKIMEILVVLMVASAMGIMCVARNHQERHEVGRKPLRTVDDEKAIILLTADMVGKVPGE